MSNMPGQDPLVSAQWLSEHLGQPGLRVLDCTTYMTPRPVGSSLISSGRPDWEASHIPGSQHIDIVDDLSDPQGKFPFTLACATQVSALLSRLGIQADDHIVLYGAKYLGMVARAWWVLRTLGHQKVSILDGGWEYWLSQGLPVSSQQQHYPATQYVLDGGTHDRVASANDVQQAMEQSSATLINSLGPDQHAGSPSATHYGRPGRIPNSVNLPARFLTDASTQLMLTDDALLTLIAQAGIPQDKNAPLITYCGGGIAASTVLFALHRLGWQDIRLYDNSLLEWSVDAARPMVCDS